jgi:dTDP-4-dehydrorhamnose reductase
VRILILGGDGMLGHQLVASLAPDHEVIATLRQGPEAYRRHAAALAPARCLFAVDVRDTARLQSVIVDHRVDAIVNAVGIVKQRDAAKEAVVSLQVNALLPNLLAQWCAELGIRLIHFSTDCVFSGRKGMYRDDDPADADDLYGRTKFLGEVGGPGCVTMRTSIIGLELSRKSSLIEWFLAQRGVVNGFTGAIYSGFTTLEAARIVDHVLRRHPDRNGIYNVSSEPISKFDLLSMIRERLGLAVEIVPDHDFRCDRSLDSSRFRSEFGYTPRSWPAMVDELCAQIERRANDS